MGCTYYNFYKWCFVFYFMLPTLSGSDPDKVDIFIFIHFVDAVFLFLVFLLLSTLWILCFYY